MNTTLVDIKPEALSDACEKFHKLSAAYRKAKTGAVATNNATAVTSATTPTKASLNFPFTLVAPDLALVEGAIRAEAKAFEENIQPYMDYILATSGKRIRPALAMLVTGALSGGKEDATKLGAVLEMIHLATLVHDDIMDGAAIRRNLATAAAKWGNALSVLLGDCLFARALEVAAGFDSTLISRKIAAASNEVCMGEILQTQRRFDFNLTREEYYKVIRMKTAALFRCATELAAYLSGADEPTQNAMARYGDALGTAYQIYDDLVDLVGSETEVGKTLGTDLIKGKITLPLLILRDEATDAQRLKLHDILLQRGNLDTTILAGIADYNGALAKSVEEAKQLLIEARQCLALLPENDYTTALEGITFYVDTLLEKCC